MAPPVAPPSPPPAGQSSGPPRASVALAPVRPRNVLTDANGRFEFTALAAGAYRIRVQPPMFSGQYLPAVFGGRDPMDAGRTIELKEGEQFRQAEIALRRGGAIAGRVFDDDGEPVTRVMVFPSRVMPGTGRLQRTGGGLLQTDDYGRYRIFGLEPGEYVVGAEARGMSGPPIDGVEPEGFMPTYHPSTPNEYEAVRIRVRGGADTEGIDIQLIRTRTYKITGIVMDSQGRPSARPNVSLSRSQGSMGFGGGFSNDADGRFTIRDVVPGDYTLHVFPMREPPGSGTPQLPREYAAIPLSVHGDIENLVVTTQPGVTIEGQVVFADGPPPADLGTMRVMPQPAPPNRMPMFGPANFANIGTNHRFTLTDLFGPQLVRVSLRRDLALKAIMLGATDITDTPVEFKREHSGHLQIVVSTRPATVEGAVTGDDGAPVEQAMVLIFPEDRQSWRVGSPRIRTTMSSTGGKYSASGLVGGRYFAIALPARSIGLMPDTPPEFFQDLARDATRLVVADDERRIVDLRLTSRTQ